MRKLTDIEQSALDYLYKHGSLCPGESVPKEVFNALDGLVRKKRAIVTATDDGPRYYPIVHAA